MEQPCSEYHKEPYWAHRVSSFILMILVAHLEGSVRLFADDYVIYRAITSGADCKEMQGMRSGVLSGSCTLNFLKNTAMTKRN